MIDQKILLIVGVIILLVFILIISARTVESNLLKGFWRADPTFCKEAELDLFILYIGDSSSCIYNTRFGYMLAKNANGLILNNSVNISFGISPHLNPAVAFCRKYNCGIDWQGNKNENFPSEVKLAYYPLHQKLVFYDNTSTHAILYKDTEMSSMIADNTLVPNDVKKKEEKNYSLEDVE